MQRIPFRCICVSTNVRIGRDQATAIPWLSFLFLEEHITSYIEMLLSTEESTMSLRSLSKKVAKRRPFSRI